RGAAGCEGCARRRVPHRQRGVLSCQLLPAGGGRTAKHPALWRWPVAAVKKETRVQDRCSVRRAVARQRAGRLRQADLARRCGVHRRVAEQRG
ncbi:unnamed protein product, partial [Effrenium voratum]